VHKGDNLPPSCATVTKSGNLNFLESPGPVQACNGTALPCTVNEKNTVYPKVHHLHLKSQFFTVNCSNLSIMLMLMNTDTSNKASL